MANEEQLSILKQGVEVWNKWRITNRIDFVDLSGVDLSNSVFRGVNLRHANLSKTNFHSALIVESDLSECNLEETSFKNAELSMVNLSYAYLKGTDFTGAFLASLLIDRTDLSNSLGLEQANHSGPSSIGTNTIQFSKGKIPEKFLRGCGLSDLEIESAKLAKPGLDAQQVTDITYKIHQLYLGKGIQYYSCFISYSSKDQEFAQSLHDDLQNEGVRCWFDREDLKIGDTIRPTIDRQIRLRDKLLVILSENSIKSEWVGDEVEGALEEEQKGNRSVLFPIRLDDTVLNTRDDWAAKIKRRRHIGDFSNWKDENSYQKSFERLLRDLKATE